MVIRFCAVRTSDASATADENYNLLHRRAPAHKAIESSGEVL